MAKITVRTQVNFTAETKYGRLTDALYYDPKVFAEMEADPKQLDVAIDERVAGYEAMRQKMEEDAILDAQKPPVEKQEMTDEEVVRVIEEWAATWGKAVPEATRTKILTPATAIAVDEKPIEEVPIAK